MTAGARPSRWPASARTAGTSTPVRCVKPCAAWRFTSRTAGSPSIRGNRDDTWSRGHICPKGATLGALHEDPDRIRRPMIKVDGQWQEVSWDAAFRRCTELLAPVIEQVRHRRGDLLHRQPARALVLARPLHRCAARHVGHSADLLTGHRRPVAEEPVVASDVRRLVDVPGARHRAHRPAGRDGRQPGRIAGLAARRARRDGHHRRNSQARQGDCHRPGAHRHGRARRRVAADHAGHRRGAAAGRRAHAVRGEPGLAR